jgi:5-methylcytosine-specific restriction endonuclease McrA
MTSCQKLCKKCNVETERYKDGTCKPCVRAKNKAWVARNRDARNAKCREWNAKNAEAKRATNAKYRLKNKALINERRRLKRALDPNIERIKTAKRRIAGYYIPKNIVEKLLNLQGDKCACCGEPLAGAYHLDHKIPISRGGTNEEHNLQLLLPKCNLEKYNLTFEEFLEKRRGNGLHTKLKQGINTSLG